MKGKGNKKDDEMSNEVYDTTRNVAQKWGTSLKLVKMKISCTDMWM